MSESHRVPGTTAGTYTMLGAIKFYTLATAITANSTLVPTGATAGAAIAMTTHATGRGKLYYSDGTKWQYVLVA